MPPENDFLPFAVDSGANVLTQAQYAALTSLLQNGFSAGIAPSVQVNKVWRQSSIMASVIAQFIAQQTGQNAIDDGTTATLLGNLSVALQGPSLTYAHDTSTTANTITLAMTPAITSYVDGQIIRFEAANTNTGACTINAGGGSVNLVGQVSTLQGGEIVATAQYEAIYSAATGQFVLVGQTAGPMQVVPATKSNQAVNLGQFGSTLSGSGYQKFPSGLILQWGTAVSNSSGIATLTLPITFPTALFSAVVNYVQNGTGGGVAATYSNTSTVSQVVATAFNTSSATPTSSAQIFFIAIGH